jgi:hypothetical protein
VSRRVVDLLALPLDPADLLVECLGPIPEWLLSCRALLVKLGVVSPKVAPSSASSADALESSCQPLCLFQVALSASRATWAISASAS